MNPRNYSAVGALSALLGLFCGCSLTPTADHSHLLATRPPPPPGENQAVPAATTRTPAPDNTETGPAGELSAAPAPPPVSEIIVVQLPRTPRNMTAPPQLSKSQVWIPGYWTWPLDRYVWVADHWETPPPDADVWVKPSWEPEGHGIRFHEGHWHASPTGAAAPSSSASEDRSRSTPPIHPLPETK